MKIGGVLDQSGRISSRTNIFSRMFRMDRVNVQLDDAFAGSYRGDTINLVHGFGVQSPANVNGEVAFVHNA